MKKWEIFIIVVFILLICIYTLNGIGMPNSNIDSIEKLTGQDDFAPIVSYRFAYPTIPDNSFMYVTIGMGLLILIFAGMIIFDKYYKDRKKKK